MRIGQVPMIDDEPDSTPTPVDVPHPQKDGRTKSGELRLGLAVCPKCNGAKGSVCDYCDGVGKVPLSKHHEYVGLHPARHDTPIPDTEPESR